MKVQPLCSASQCIPWLVVLIIECLAIVILNIITIVVFVKKKRQLQRRSTYLIIHLAIVDLLVGVVSGPLQIEHIMGWSCPLWNYRQRTIWPHNLSFAFLHLFSFASLTNLIAVSLERLHATFCPFRHRFVRKWVYRAIIIAIWLIPVVREAVQIFLRGIVDRVVINTYLYILFYAVSLFVICVSYILIIIKVRCSRHPQFHSRSKRERKLTGTALIVSLVSLLCFLPAMIYAGWAGNSSTYIIKGHIPMAVLVLFLGNSLVNPIIYARRMPGFREGLLQLVYRVPDLSRIAPANLLLRNLRRAKIDGRKTIDEVCFLNNFNFLAEQHFSSISILFVVSIKILTWVKTTLVVYEQMIDTVQLLSWIKMDYSIALILCSLA